MTLCWWLAIYTAAALSASALVVLTASRAYRYRTPPPTDRSGAFWIEWERLA